jgi:site-specific recombinase XerD
VKSFTNRVASSTEAAGVDLLEVQKILGHHSILTTARYTHLTSHTNEQMSVRIEALMSRFHLDWAGVK